MRRDRWPVILEAGFRENVAKGWSVNIFCSEVHRSKSNLWTGRWQIACVSPDGEERRLLVIQRNIEPREFLTANGVISFLVDIGFVTAALPVQVGASVSLGPEHRVVQDPSEPIRGSA